MTVFEKVTAENTIPALKMAAERAKQDGVHLVVASTGGDTALKAVEAAKEAGVLGKLVIVGSVQSRGVQKMAPETLQMLKELGVQYVIIGHSERRQYFGETDFTVNKKVIAALEAGLHPIICVGETLDQRELGVTMELIALQLKSALAGVPAEKARKCVIAYEPVWAIGTGKTATAQQAAEVCTFIRSTIRHLYGARIARSVTVQYGGSMKPANAAELLAQPDIDGGLIGGAALDAGQFVDIINAANQD